MKKINRIKQSFFVLLAFISLPALAQGTQGIDSAAGEINKYFTSVGNLVLAIAAVVGLVGAIRVYIAWNNGDQDINKKIMGWFGAILFIVIVGVVLKAFFPAAV